MRRFSSSDNSGQCRRCAALNSKDSVMTAKVGMSVLHEYLMNGPGDQESERNSACFGISGRTASAMRRTALAGVIRSEPSQNACSNGMTRVRTTASSSWMPTRYPVLRSGVPMHSTVTSWCAVNPSDGGIPAKPFRRVRVASFSFTSRAFGNGIPTRTVRWSAIDSGAGNVLKVGESDATKGGARRLFSLQYACHEPPEGLGVSLPPPGLFHLVDAFIGAVAVRRPRRNDPRAGI